LKEVGVHTSPLGELFAAWLYRRHRDVHRRAPRPSWRGRPRAGRNPPPGAGRSAGDCLPRHQRIHASDGGVGRRGLRSDADAACDSR
jgi:hypothetical protein